MIESYLFMYGRTPSLARFEAHSVFPAARFTTVTSAIDLVEGLLDSPESLIKRLGGITRVSKEVAVREDLTPESIADAIHKEESGNREFRFILSTDESVSLYASVPLEVKKKLELLGHTVRFSLSQKMFATAAQVLQKNTVEYSIISIQERYLLCKTLAIQDPNAWTKRDIGRPSVDPKRGMLPLKVARVVANIALGNNPQQMVCCDPFCGMGSILSEGVTIGGTWYGSDIRIDAVEGTKKNLSWLGSKNNLSGNVERIFLCDAVHLSKELPAISLDSIVTEPFLGNPALGEKRIIEKKKIRNMMKGLEKMFLGCLRDWHIVLKPNGRIIIALPSFSIETYKETVKKVIDSCESLGYSIEAGPFTYGRPDAVVERNFYILKKR